jgi:hypothetical protein
MDGFERLEVALGLHRGIYGVLEGSAESGALLG